MTCLMETFSYVKVFYIEFNKEIFPGDLSQTLSKSTWVKLVRNILTINYMPCTSLKNELNSSFAGFPGQTSDKPCRLMSDDVIHAKLRECWTYDS